LSFGAMARVFVNTFWKRSLDMMLAITVTVRCRRAVGLL
jgi:hypothetical protein